MGRYKLLFIIVLIATLTATGFALINDFSGTYTKIPTIRDPWCGLSIEIKKIRFNKYRITWVLITGERSVVELFGKIEGDLIDFRKNQQGYTYQFIDNKKKLTVTLDVPEKKIVCHYVREREKE